MGKFICPLPFNSISLEAGYQSRICCHDLTGATDQYSLDKTDKLHQEVQEKMLNEEIPKNCEYCKNIEDSGGFSPRLDYLQQFPDFDPINPRCEYLDITIDSNCNLSCRMCTPHYSIPLEKTFKKLNIPTDDAFIKEWREKQKDFPTLLNDLKSKFSSLKKIVITGGEPFISKNAELFIKELCNSEYAKNISVRFFTNLSVLPKWLPELLDKTKSVEVYMSLDGSKEFCSYIRYPLSWDQTLINIKALTELRSKKENLVLRIHTVVQALNLTNLFDLIKELQNFKNDLPFIPSFTLLDSPSCLRASVLPEQIKLSVISELRSNLNQLVINKGDIFSKELSLNLNSLLSLLDSIEVTNDDNNFMDFMLYCKKFDEDRNQSVTELIPSLAKKKKA